MDKRKKIILITSGALLVGVYFIVKYLQNLPPSKNAFVSSLQKASSGLTNTVKSTSQTVAKALPSASFPLKNGSYGLEVKRLQTWLNDNGFASPKLIADGVFGAKTESAVSNMQSTGNRAIYDYINNLSFTTSSIVKGAVSKDFYDFFVTKTRTYVANKPLF